MLCWWSIYFYPSCGHEMQQRLIDRRIAAIKQGWSAVALETMVPLALTDQQTQALASGTRHRRSRALRLALPMPVATIKPEIAAVLIDIARKDTPETQEAWASDPRRKTIESQLERDFKQLAVTLLQDNKQEVSLTLRAQTYREAPTPFLHSDQTTGDRQFIARIGALPFEAISGALEAKANPTTRALIAAAQSQLYEDKMQQALAALRAQGTLQRADLNTVYLLYPRYFPRKFGPKRHVVGTLHCSSPCNEPTPSTFIRASLGPPRP